LLRACRNPHTRWHIVCIAPFPFPLGFWCLLSFWLFGIVVSEDGMSVDLLVEVIYLDFRESYLLSLPHIILPYVIPSSLNAVVKLTPGRGIYPPMSLHDCPT
jgi:hypothetical protein